MESLACLADEIRGELAKKRLTQGELARAVGVTDGTMSRLLVTGDFRADLLLKAAEFLGVRASDLLARAERQAAA